MDQLTQTSESKGIARRIARLRYLGPAVVLAALVFGVAAAGANSPAGTGSPPEFVASVTRTLFSGPPDHSAVAADALSKASDIERQAIRNGTVSQDDYLAQAQRTGTCVAERLGAEVTAPTLQDDRAVWSIRVHSGHNGAIGDAVHPSSDVARVSRECHSQYLANVERLWLSSTLPQGAEWTKLRGSFVRCLGAPDNVASVASAMFKEVSKPGPGSCMERYALLLESVD